MRREFSLSGNISHFYMQIPTKSNTKRFLNEAKSVFSRIFEIFSLYLYNLICKTILRISFYG